MTGLFPPLKDETRQILDRLPGIIDKTFPLPARFHAALPRDVAELSRLLTSERENRGASYLGRPALLSAYLRYFLPWNIYRLCRLLGSLPLDLKDNDVINDLGAGPLTLAASLWICRPELRNTPLEFRCLDRTTAVLDAGKKFFAALTAGTTKSAACPWAVRTIRGELKRNGVLSVVLRGKPAALSAAVNVYNELFWNFSPFDTEGLDHFVEKQVHLLSSLTESSGSILVVEPGIPRSGEFISLLRAGLIRESRPPLSPCTHQGACALPGRRARGNSKTAGGGTCRRIGQKAGPTGRGINDTRFPSGKAKWCHFAFDTEDAPTELHKLSAAANIPKERAVLSFILVGPKSPKPAAESDHAKPSFGHSVRIRIISDSFPVSENTSRKRNPPQGVASMMPGSPPGLWGRYGCSENGLVLVTGSRENLETSPSGTLEELPFLDNLKDEKSGALIAHHLS